VGIVLRRLLVICLVGLIFFSIIPLSLIMDRAEQANTLRVQDGVMDLSVWNHEQSQIIKLDGDWEFYWNRLLTPEDFQGGVERFPVADWIEVPSTWNGKLVDGDPLPAFGFATYRMKLDNLPHSGIFALKKSNIRFSSKIFVNGQTLFEDGTPSVDAGSYESGNVPQIGFFSSEDRDVEIIVQVANYDYSNAGIPLSIYFGKQDAMLEFDRKSAAYEAGSFAILAILSLIYVICFVTATMYRKRDDSLLYFAALCLLYAIYNGLTGERILSLVLHGISFEALYKIKDLSSIAGFVVLAVFFYQWQKNIISLRFTQTVTIILSAFFILVALLPIHTYMIIHPYVIIVYQIMLIWLQVRIASLYMKSSGIERIKSFLLFMAVLCINLHSVNMILFGFVLKGNLWVGQVYILVFNIIMISLIVLRFFEAYRTIDEMKNQLLELDRIKDEFLSNTSHELKTPLNAIVNITDTLMRGVEGPVSKEQERNLAMIMSSGRRLTQLVNELLDYSKMKHGDIVLNKSAVDLKAIIESVLRIHSFMLGGKQIALVNNISLDIPMVYADGNRLIQILHNLIGNAIKFTDQGMVDISAEVRDHKVEVRVRDTGIGISQHMLGRIFQPFEQVDASITKRYGGTGLGLSITKKLVELHGGDIQANSSSGQGSAFTFTLPVARLATKTIKGMPDENTLPTQHVDASFPNYPLHIKGEKDDSVLVVDDDFANLLSMINLFKLEGYSATVVNRGQMALDELFRKNDFSLVVLDIMMPDMSGYEVLQRIRERFSAYELPILMLTAKNRTEDTILSMEYGANDFVGKPFEAEELMARVRSLIELKRSVKNARDAEIAFLRSQINPHFLYNALNSIAALCMDEPQKAEELTLQLSQYLRGSFDFKQLDSFTTLNNELDLVKAYVHIEKARFGARLQVEYHIAADGDILIPPLILQPLVENAIRHGLMSKMQGGQVNITVKQQPDAAVAIAVEDNGCGMSEEKLEEVLGLDKQKKGVGLWNINQRLKLLYGKGIFIESVEGGGTKIFFDIPADTTN
jgi:two-component system sensor histidine kinase ChiS